MEAISVFCGVADLWRPPRTPSLREGVCWDVEVSACGECGPGDERNMFPFLPPPSLPDGVEVFEDAGGGDKDW